MFGAWVASCSRLRAHTAEPGQRGLNLIQAALPQVLQGGAGTFRWNLIKLAT